MTNEPARPAVAAQATYQAELDQLRVREKAHTREGNAPAAARPWPRSTPASRCPSPAGRRRAGHSVDPDGVDGP